jgi:hypothetical protein
VLIICFFWRNLVIGIGYLLLFQAVTRELIETAKNSSSKGIILFKSQKVNCYENCKRRH